MRSFPLETRPATIKPHFHCENDDLSLIYLNIFAIQPKAQERLVFYKSS